MKKDYIHWRMKEVAAHILDTKETLRETAKHLRMSKSTVHLDIMRLKKENKELFEKVYKVVAANKADRHNRGGEATRIKYLGGH